MSSKKSSLGGSMKFSFKSLEEDEEDEEELTSVSKDLEIKKEPPPRPVGPPGSAHKQSVDYRPPKLQATSKSLEEDKISGLKSKLKTNFTDIKAKVVKKLEDFHHDISSSPDSDTERNVEEEDDEKADGNSEVTLVVQADAETKKSEISENDGKIYTEIETEEKVSETVADQEEFQIVDDFYDTDTTSLQSSISAIPTAPEIRYRNKSLPQKLKPKSKGTSVVSAAPVSLSNIREHAQVDDSPVKDSAPEGGGEEAVGDVFHDVKPGDNNNAHGGGTPQTSSVPTHNTSQKQHVPWKNIITASVVVTFYWIIPLPSYISGLIMGVFLTTLCSIAYIKLTTPPPPRPDPQPLPLDQLPPFIMPEMKDVKTEDYVFRGWMNEIVSYDPFRYSINDTHVVHVLLERTKLRLRRTKANIPKRAVWDEFIPNVTDFVHGRHFDIKGSRVFLKPEGLVQKRLWSKKYPICIELVKKDKPLEKKERTMSDSVLDKTTDSGTILPRDETFHGFELVTNEKCDDNILYLFARTSREKEDWFRRFQAAAAGKPLKSNLGRIRKFFETKIPQNQKESQDGEVKQHQRRESNESLGENQESGMPTHTRQDSADSVQSLGLGPIQQSEGTSSGENLDMEQFVRYMSKLMPRDMYDRFSPPYKRNVRDSNMIDCEDQVLWVNAFVSRCFWDFLRHKKYANWVMDKIQKKLERIHTPYFIEKLKLTDINLGSVMPVLRKASRPYFDEDGLWVNLALNYGGGFKMTIETKVNLMKLRDVEVKRAERETKEKEKARKKLAILDENEEDSAESSTDEEEENSLTGSNEEGGKKKFMNILNKITQSKYFKSATEMKYVKKAMEGVSNTPLILTVECRFLSGELALNIPFPPTDRLWYGFNGNPKLSLVAKPKVGAREVTVTYITEWIEKKLATEFQVLCSFVSLKRTGFKVTYNILLYKQG
ncbi:hypothetical protein FSP39_020588 [Pinctada imbricata]|uniref:Testis-expressed sequence 2 protein n=1 Tax=Pinctada imbricata TaxID=66713 RepID=A0AA88XW83_PINIB|nr:hypothetical protein FSP39_020588 [Pinctada imbricata]